MQTGDLARLTRSEKRIRFMRVSNTILWFLLAVMLTGSCVVAKLLHDQVFDRHVATTLVPGQQMSTIHVAALASSLGMLWIGAVGVGGLIVMHRELVGNDELLLRLAGRGGASMPESAKLR